MLLPFTYSHTKPQSERAYFTAIKCIGPFTDQNDNFPSLPYPTTCEIPTISYPSSRKKGNPFLGRASCVGHNREYPPPSQHTPPPFFQMPLPLLFTVIRLQRKLSQISPPQHAASEILTQNWPSLSRDEGEGGREESHIKVTGIFTVSLGGLNCRFLSHSRFLAMESLFAHSGITYRACKKKVTKKCRDLLVWSPFEPHPHWSPLGV